MANPSSVKERPQLPLARDDFRARADSELALYERRASPLFGFLDNASQKGFTPQQFETIRDNFVLRTQRTISSIAKLVAAAALNRDAETLETARRNLCEEIGCPDGVPHVRLLIEACDWHSERVFGLPPFSLERVSSSESILRETHELSRIQAELYDSPSYPDVLGASYAQEAAAVTMISALYRSVFLPYHRYYRADEFAQVAEYFRVHMSGLEERHAQDALDAVFRRCATREEQERSLGAMRTFLSAQAGFWDGLARSLEVQSGREPIVAIFPGEDCR